MKSIAVCLLVALFAGCSASPAPQALPAADDGITGAGPVKRLDVYVLPYYESAKTSGGRPRVEVGKEIDEALSSNSRLDIVAVRDAVQKQPATITPITMMVLAIRLYDVGQRDDAVFWFEAARLRYGTMAAVLDTGSPDLAQHAEAVRIFLALAGPSI